MVTTLGINPNIGDTDIATRELIIDLLYIKDIIRIFSIGQIEIKLP